MPKSLFTDLLKNVPASASVAIDGTSSSEFGKYVDTGSYVLNAALSGSLFGGMPDNKITVFAGESSTGKTFFILSILKAWMQQNPTGNVIYFDTESAVTNQMLTERGLDLSRIAKVEPETIEQFRQSALAILDNYEAAKTNTPIIMVLDSLGNLSSLKEVTDIRDQKDSRDMTKAQLIRGTFRVLRLRLAKLAVPMLVTNHVYAVVGAYVPTKALSGGSGLIYVSDSIAMLSKSKVRDKDKNIIGNDVTIKMYKSRLSRENNEVDVRILYTGGLDRHYGLLELAEAAGMITVAAGRYTFPNQTKSVTATKIAETPEAFFTPEFLQTLDETFVKPNFSYGHLPSTSTSGDSTDE
jgi:RecA/RadA recombinase